MRDRRITAIIPIFNVSDYVEECLASVLGQSCTDFCICLINDGSTDDSWDKALRLAKGDSRVTFVSQANKGLGSARNLGIRIAETEYVTFLDSDDWWTTDYIERMNEGIQDGQSDLVLADLYYVDGKEGDRLQCKTSVLRLPRGVVSKREKNLLSRARNFAWGKTFRRNLFADHSAWFSAHPYEDVSIVPFLTAVAERIYSLGKPLLYYRRTRQGSIRNKVSNLRFVAQSVQELCNRFRQTGLFDKYYKDLRQLAWGQYVFVHKWIRSHAWDCDAGGDISRVCFSIFPELEAFAAGKFYVVAGEDEVLWESITKLLPSADSIAQDEDSADFVVRFAAGEAARREIEIPKHEATSDVETLAWDLAEDIMERL